MEDPRRKGRARPADGTVSVNGIKDLLPADFGQEDCIPHQRLKLPVQRPLADAGVAHDFSQVELSLLIEKEERQDFPLCLRNKTVEHRFFLFSF